MQRVLLRLWMKLLACALALLAGGLSLRPALAADEAGQDGAKKPTRIRPVTLWNDCVGKMAAPPDTPHPTLKLKSARFTSPERIGPGGSIKVVARMNRPASGHPVRITLIGSAPGQDGGPARYLGEDSLELWDDGTEGDAKANDGEWYGELICGLDEDAVFTGSASLEIAEYQPQSVPIQGEVYYDAPGNSPAGDGAGGE